MSIDYMSYMSYSYSQYFLHDFMDMGSLLGAISGTRFDDKMDPYVYYYKRFFNKPNINL